jgi:hypothetical protein
MAETMTLRPTGPQELALVRASGSRRSSTASTTSPSRSRHRRTHQSSTTSPTRNCSRSSAASSGGPDVGRTLPVRDAGRIHRFGRSAGAVALLDRRTCEPMPGLGSSNRLGDFGERHGHLRSWRGVDGEFVVSAEGYSAGSLPHG